MMTHLSFLCCQIIIDLSQLSNESAFCWRSFSKSQAWLPGSDRENKHLLCDLSRLVNITDNTLYFTQSPRSFVSHSADVEASEAWDTDFRLKCWWCVALLLSVSGSGEVLWARLLFWLTVHCASCLFGYVWCHVLGGAESCVRSDLEKGRLNKCFCASNHWEALWLHI